MSYSVVSLLISISSKKLFRWHKDVLSWFNDKEVQEELHRLDTIDKKKLIKDKITWEIKPATVYVPIFNEDNIWEDMSLDDKEIWWIWYSILTNKLTRKIALMISSTKADIVFDILRKMPQEVREKVKTISRDLAPNYEVICRYAFMKAIQVWDKFHVIKLALEALKDVRVRYRQEILTYERKIKQEIKNLIKQWKWESEEALELKKKLKDIKEKTFENWDSIKQLLAKSRYLLFKFKNKWSYEENERAKILFEQFPEIKAAYGLICWFRWFYKIKHSKPDSMKKAKASLNKWYKKVEEYDIEEISNFMSTVQNHENCILNYFESWQTNANAESINSRIQRFMWLNYWIRNRNFFHFRMKQYFS